MGGRRKKPGQTLKRVGPGFQIYLNPPTKVLKANAIQRIKTSFDSNLGVPSLIRGVKAAEAAPRQREEVGDANPNPTHASTVYSPFNCARRTGKHLAQKESRLGSSGRFAEREAKDPANLQPHADVHDAEAPTRPAGAKRRHFSLSVVTNWQRLAAQN